MQSHCGIDQTDCQCKMESKINLNNRKWIYSVTAVVAAAAVAATLCP